MSNLRKIERLENDKWVVVKMSDLVPGDTFRMPFREDDIDIGIFEATGMPFQNEEGIGTIDCRFIRLDE